MLRRRLIVILAVLLVGSGAAFAIAVLLPPVYQSQAKFIVESQQIPSDLVRSTVNTFADETLQIIQQRITTRDAILGMIKKLSLFANRRNEMSPTEMVDEVRKSISIERTNLDLSGARGRRGTVTIAFTASAEDRYPQVAAAIANELVTLILNENVKSRTARAAETVRFIQSETDKKRAELAQIEARISKFKQDNDPALPDKLQFQLSRLGRAKSDMTSLDQQIQSSKDQERLLQFELDVKSSQTGTDASALTLDKQLQTLNAELIRKESLLSNTHPDIIALKAQIATLKAQADAPKPASNPKSDAPTDGTQPLNPDLGMLKEKIGGLRRNRALMEKQRADLAKTVETLNQIIDKAPEVQSALTNLQRQRDNAQKAVDGLASKLEEAKLGQKLEQDQQAERFDVIEQPIVPTEPIKPKRLRILGAGIGLSAVAAFGLAFLLEQLRSAVQGSSDITAALGQPPLASIPRFSTVSERRRRRRRLTLIIVTAFLVIAAALAAIHFLYMPLDVVFHKVLGRLGI